MSETLEGTLAVLETFFPQRCSTPSFTGKSFGWGLQVLGGCFTIMMCNVFGNSFWGEGGVLGGRLPSNVCSVFYR